MGCSNFEVSNKRPIWSDETEDNVATRGLSVPGRDVGVAQGAASAAPSAGREALDCSQPAGCQRGAASVRAPVCARAGRPACRPAHLGGESEHSLSEHSFRQTHGRLRAALLPPTAPGAAGETSLRGRCTCVAHPARRQALCNPPSTADCPPARAVPPHTAIPMPSLSPTMSQVRRVGASNRRVARAALCPSVAPLFTCSLAWPLTGQHRALAQEGG